eukprot:13951909-Alexandrium_andersonii.AAC.1
MSCDTAESWSGVGSISRCRYSPRAALNRSNIRAVRADSRRAMSASAVTSTTEDSLTLRSSGAAGGTPPKGGAPDPGAGPAVALTPGGTE